MRISTRHRKEIDVAAAQAHVRKRLGATCRQMRWTWLRRCRRKPKKARLGGHAFHAFAAHAGP
ncbi:hypothetical protein KM317_11815 [Xanthomonas translucens pv. arrhenatheri]|uniref:hypothetical protein n=1 Tax=Xanthomonas graminis TaxID=3390026 RepID=UPI0012DA5A08|nr:hypothetical protein [Xanthomonas translucens]UKE76181.1 hypothetical protein KM317_11815 [Xanthomonas translucens pv. arrhenatheri]